MQSKHNNLTAGMINAGNEIATCLMDASIQNQMGGIGGCKEYDLNSFPKKFHQIIERYLANHIDSVQAIYTAMEQQRACEENENCFCDILDLTELKITYGQHEDQVIYFQDVKDRHLERALNTLLSGAQGFDKFEWLCENISKHHKFMIGNNNLVNPTLGTKVFEYIVVKNMHEGSDTFVLYVTDVKRII